ADEPCAGNGCFVLVSSNMEDNTSINCTGLQISRLPVSFFDNWRNNIRGNVEVIFMNDSNNSNMVRVNLPLAKKWAD
ncbi:MAG: hypothetical protein KDD40_09325, partial [Bdellovibrionales bacterium]|nr:hypothetical protein [Bdellovibrionales bacterium]